MKLKFIKLTPEKVAIAKARDNARRIANRKKRKKSK